MNIARNMEAILFAAIIVVGGSGVASAAVHKLQHKAPAATAIAVADSPMPVVTVTAKRLTAEQKAAL